MITAAVVNFISMFILLLKILFFFTVNSYVGNKNDLTGRNIILDKEILEWAAVLQLSSFLSNSKCQNIHNIYNKLLSSDQDDFQLTKNKLKNILKLF